jgi:medium-chain acyl-[acyl-carrier-protein] hydrolase
MTGVTSDQELSIRSRWIARPRPAAGPALRVICFPHVGAGGAAFNSWLGRLPAGVDLCVIRLPGRENRLHEPLIDDWRGLFGLLEPEVTPLLDRPFAVLGHCSGSVLAYEFTRRLRAAGRPAPVLLVLSSAEAPAVRRIDDPLHVLPDRELIERIIGYGGMAPEVLGDPGLMALFGRILRADYQVIERLEYSAGPPLDVPITVIGGRHDEFVSSQAMAAWSAETTREFSLHLIDAGHYILSDAGGLVADILRHLVERGI